MDAVLAGLVVPNVQNHSLAALARAARGAGFSVARVPFGGFADVEPAARAVSELRPRLFGLSIQATESALASATLVELLRRRGYAGLVVVGGHFATLNAEELLRDVPGIDAVVRFGGEAALVALLQSGLDDDVARVPGLVCRARDGALRHGAAPALDVLPRAFTDDDALPLHLGFRAADLVLSRGCEAHCGYCCVAGASDVAERLGARYERRDVGQIADTLASLHHEAGVRVFNFMDDNLLPLDAEGALAWTQALGDALRARDVGDIAFSLQLRADVCAPAVVDALAELGLARAYVGIDGYSGRQLVALGRDAPADAGPRALAHLGRAGVFSVCNALVLGPTFAFDSLVGEIEALARVREAPVHLLPIDVRAGSAYFERVRRRGLLEGGPLCWRYRFADPRTALLGEALLGFPSRLEEYSVPVALYDLGYNLGVARRLLPGADVTGAVDLYRDVTRRWNADQMRVLRAAAAAAATGDRRRVLALVEAEGGRVRRLDDELRALVAEALALVERGASRAHGEVVRAHTRGRLLGAVALSAALAACNSPRPLSLRDAGTEIARAADAVGYGPPDAIRAEDATGDHRLDANLVEDGPGCPSSLISSAMLPGQGCGGSPGRGHLRRARCPRWHSSARRRNALAGGARLRAAAARGLLLPVLRGHDAVARVAPHLDRVAVMPLPSRTVCHVMMWTLAGSTVVAACSSSNGPSDGGVDAGGSGGQGGGAAGAGGASGASGGHAGTAAGGTGGQVDAGACRMQGESCNPPQYCCSVGMICAGICTMGVGQGPSDGAAASDGGPACGASTCRSDQVCVHPSCGGGTPPMCEEPSDGGQCPAGWTYQPNCVGGFIGGAGCVPPSSCTPQSPFCADVPASCGGRPSCTCLPADVCKGNGSCGSVYTSGDVMCGFA